MFVSRVIAQSTIFNFLSYSTPRNQPTLPAIQYARPQTSHPTRPPNPQMGPNPLCVHSTRSSIHRTSQTPTDYQQCAHPRLSTYSRIHPKITATSYRSYPPPRQPPPRQSAPQPNSPQPPTPSPRTRASSKRSSPFSQRTRTKTQMPSRRRRSWRRCRARI